MLLYPRGVRVTSQDYERWPGVWSGSPGALVDVLAAARRRLNCFQVVFKASFYSCWALPVPSREIDLDSLEVVFLD